VIDARISPSAQLTYSANRQGVGAFAATLKSAVLPACAPARALSAVRACGRPRFYRMGFRNLIFTWAGLSSAVNAMLGIDGLTIIRGDF